MVTVVQHLINCEAGKAILAQRQLWETQLPQHFCSQCGSDVDEPQSLFPTSGLRSAIG